MDKKETAYGLNIVKGEAHRNCCQSVFAAFCGDYGISADTAFRLAACFGGGMQRGEICGAATGALMALGLEFGHGEKSRRLALEFLNRFEAKTGSLLCRELKINGSGKEWLSCPNLVRLAAGLAEEIISENK